MSDAGGEDLYTPGADDFRTVLGRFVTGVTIVTSMQDGRPVGVAANSFTSVSLDPPLVLFCVARTSTTWPAIEASGRFAVNILGEHQEETSRLFATRGVDRFASVEWHLSARGLPVLAQCLGYLDCETWAVYDGGDHLIAVGRVLDLAVMHDAGPLLFFQGRYGRMSVE
jgi:3-hydroxy-9,10-secoandrosta-1,3,5(10)-triene-9,17-dione monooxygenase reductase component